MTARRWAALALLAVALVGATVIVVGQELEPACACQIRGEAVRGAGYVLVIEARTDADGTTTQGAVMYPSDPCDWDYIRNSYFLSLIYGCEYGGSSGAE